MKKPDPTLTPAQVQQLREDEREANEIHSEILKAQRAGIDLRMEQATVEALIRQIGQVLDVYGGGRKRA